MKKLMYIGREPRLTKHNMKTKCSNQIKGRSRVDLTPRKACLVVLCLLFLSTSPVLTFAEPVDLAQKKTEANRIKDQLRNIDNELDITVEKYNHANVKLGQTQEAIKQTKESKKRASKRFSSQNKVLNQRIVSIYKNGNISFISPIFGANSFADFLTRVDYLIQISNQDLMLLQNIQKTKTELEKTEQRLKRDEKEQIALTTELLGRRRAIESQLSNRKAFFATIETDIQKAIKEEEEQEARIRAQQAQALQQQQEQRPQDNRQNNQTPQNGANNNRNRNNPNTNPTQNPPNNEPDNNKDEAKKAPDPPKSNPEHPTSAPHSGAVAIAMRQLGKPYQWGAAGPDCFDCSGLVMYCYGQLGISLPHSAAAQYNRGQKVSREHLAAGDLVFFGTSGVSHVGIYSGGAQYIHAPHTGDVVKVSALSSRKDYYGASRP